MRSIRTLIRVCIFGTMIGAGLWGVSTICRIKDASYKRVSGFWREPKNSLEVVCVGSSHAFCSWSPMAFFGEYGIASYSFGSESQPIEASYHFIEEVFRHQRPKVILLETFKFISAQEGKAIPEMPAHRAVDPFGWSWSKMGMIEDMTLQDSAENYICDLIKYHTRWSQLGRTDFCCFPPRDVCRGYQLLGRIIPIQYERWNSNAVTWDQGLNSYLASWILRINKLVTSHGAHLVIYTAPFKTSAGHNRLYRALARFCQAKGICYLNLLDSESGPDMNGNYEFCDDKDGHLNVYGAEKMTRFLGDYLVSHYPLEVLEPSVAQNWKDDYKIYNELRFQELRAWKQKKQRKGK